MVSISGMYNLFCHTHPCNTVDFSKNGIYLSSNSGKWTKRPLTVLSFLFLMNIMAQSHLGRVRVHQCRKMLQKLTLQAKSPVPCYISPVMQVKGRMKTVILTPPKIHCILSIPCAFQAKTPWSDLRPFRWEWQLRRRRPRPRPIYQHLEMQAASQPAHPTNPSSIPTTTFLSRRWLPPPQQSIRC